MPDKLEKLVSAIQTHVSSDQFLALPVKGGCVFRIKHTHAPVPTLYRPMICLIAQGSKNCHIGERIVHYGSGDIFINFLPIPVTTEVLCASADKPLLSVALNIDLVKLADMVLRIETAGSVPFNKAQDHSTCVVTGQAPEEIIDLFCRMLEVSHHPLDAEILGESLTNEIYYRLLTGHYGTELRILLNQFGKIQPIAKAVNFIHEHLTEQIKISDLAAMTHMSKTTFFNTFKKIMHVAPNQYIKSTKLRKAQVLLAQGMQANEVSFLVGYNSFSQFSREYKRDFGYSPSETVEQLKGLNPTQLPLSSVPTDSKPFANPSAQHQPFAQTLEWGRF